jgi:hypothetical protein
VGHGHLARPCGPAVGGDHISGTDGQRGAAGRTVANQEDTRRQRQRFADTINLLSRDMSLLSAYRPSYCPRSVRGLSG